MSHISNILIVVVCIVTNTLYADEILDNNVTQQEINIQQDIHWQWCGKKCRVDAKKKANKVLHRLDNLVKSYESLDSFYEDASDMFKRKATKEQWRLAFEHRKKLGSALRRIHESTQGTFKILPNVDKNKKYVIVTFDSMFKGEKGIFSEQVTLIRNKNKKYKFIGYYFAQKPYYDY